MTILLTETLRERLGQVMDDIDEVGTSEVFLGISLQGAKIFQVEMKTSHLDSTSFHLQENMLRK